MCGRYFLEASLEEIDQMIGPLVRPVRLQPRYNIAPEQPVPVIRQDAVGNHRLDMLRWGLVPSWSKGPDRRFSMINARAETLGEKPAYRSALRYRRCLLPASGFYEWRSEGKGNKQPYVIRGTEQPLLMLAGLWEHWLGEDGSELETCTIITTEANDAVKPVHDRMPVILEAGDFAQWLDRGHQHTSDIQPLLKPCDPRKLELYPVSTKVNNPQHDDASLIDRAEKNDLF